MLGILISIFGLTRLINLMRPPLFIDEALYIGWSEAIRLNPQANWLISLKEAWAPLQSWLGALFTSIVGDPLLSLRLLSVFAGAISLFLIIKLSQVLFVQNKDKLAGWLFILSPFVLMYDRLGMRDSAVTMVSLIVLLGTSLRLLKKKPKAVYLIAIGVAMGLFLKNLTWFLPGLVLASYVWFRPKISRHDFGALILASLPIWFYLTTDTWHSLTEKNQIFLSFREISLSQVRANVAQVLHWWWEYLSLPVLILIAGGIWLSWKKHRQSFYLLMIFTIPVLLFEILVAKILFPRYFLFVAVISFLWAGRGLQWLLNTVNRQMKFILIAVVFLPSIILDWQIISNFKEAKLPAIEQWQYISGWPSGYGLTEFVNYLREDEPDLLVIEDGGLIVRGIPYLYPNHQMKLVTSEKDLGLIEKSLRQGKKIYLGLNIADNPPEKFKTILLNEFERPKNGKSMKLYQIEAILR